ncbi:vacuolar fusion protein MON1 homolog [Salvia miltiorrhiza]|uniref:vacuolar fusion protein MON1 homolog n=1 Tax=Salvia miltiorrhiza TaxID=226208 RepID=UPI0025ACF90D|nr:vacuolar fusion protein MON1 homolog [Salvia miltiorrhiza]
MPSDSNSSSSNPSSDRDDGNPNTDPSSEPEPEVEPNKNPHLIDQSLDALENQLASISMSSRSPTATFDGEDEEEEEEEVEEEAESREQPTTINGSLSEEIGAEGDADFVEDPHFESDSKAESSGVNEEKISFMWRDVPEVDEVERPLSPGSSGYAGEMGSTSGGDEIIDDDEDDSEIRGAENDGVSGSHSQWVSGKRHADEDDASVSWRKRKKHFFILSHSGKPIYSRYGDEHKLAGFSATLQAIISFVENGGDRVNLVRAGKHQVVFLVKGPIYLVCISCTEEPYESLKGQLELLYGQMILILTKSVNRCFEKNPKFDMTSLLGGTDAVFSSLIHSLSWNPATFLHAYSCLPLAYATRQAAASILQDVAGSGVLFALLMCKHKVISLVSAQKASLHPDDILLLSNFIMSSESFRTSESFSPICLPRYNPMAFLYAYVHYFDIDTYLVLLTTSSDAFYHLKDCRIRIEIVLSNSNVLSEVQRSLVDGGMHIEDLLVEPTSHAGAVSSHLGQPRPGVGSPGRTADGFLGIGGPAGLWHFIYKSIYLDQYVSSEFSTPINSLRQQKRLYRAYQRLYVSMHEKGIGPHKTQFRRDENYVLLCWVTQDFELYAAFDPLADKALAIKVCNRVCQWVKDVENEIFLLGASPFSW